MIEKICSKCHETYEIAGDDILYSDEKREIVIKDSICPICKNVNHCWIIIKI